MAVGSMKAAVCGLAHCCFGNNVPIALQPVIGTVGSHVLPEGTMPCEPLHDSSLLIPTKILYRLLHGVVSRHLGTSHVSMAVQFAAEPLRDAAHLHNATDGVHKRGDI